MFVSCCPPLPVSFPRAPVFSLKSRTSCDQVQRSNDELRTELEAKHKELDALGDRVRKSDQVFLGGAVYFSLVRTRFKGERDER